jgi:hypothetical protein
VYCEGATLPSPVHQFNDKCCQPTGARREHNSAHYDSNQQVCCNHDDGFPSTREYSSVLKNSSADTTLRVRELYTRGELQQSDYNDANYRMINTYDDAIGGDRYLSDRIVDHKELAD